MTNKKVIIIGGGPSALIAADFLSPKVDVEIYEKEKNVGQKFLVAGKGGFNLTNSKTGIELVNVYSPSKFLKDSILNFDSISVRNWLSELGIQTFSGTSGRVFAEKKHKPVEVLDKIKESILSKNVKIFTNHKFIGFDKTNFPIIESKERTFSVSADYYIFAMGGASWSITGSDGKWTELFNEDVASTIPFQASNCGVNINWQNSVSDFHSGKPLKNISITVGENTVKGEAVITDYGLEGNAIYSIIPELRNKLDSGDFKISLDLKPNNSSVELFEKFNNKTASTENYKKMLNLNGIEFSIIKSFTTKAEFLDPQMFIKRIKNLSIPIESLRPIEEAISTVGGIDTHSLNPNFSLKKISNIFTIGEMVNWDAPTGGYLLQGCFSMGVQVAKSILNNLD